MRERRLWCRLPALLLAVVLLLAGCTAQQPESKAPAMGRYVEEVVPLPPGLTRVTSMTQAPSGDVHLLGEAGNGLEHWVYVDEAWTVQDAPWIEALGELDLLWYVALTLDEKGTPYCIYYPLEEGMSPDAFMGYVDDDDVTFPALVLATYQEGAWQQHPGTFTYHNTNPLMVNVLWDGSLAAGYYDTLVTYDASGSMLWEASSSDYLGSGNVVQWNGGIAYTDKDLLKLYDLETGAPVGEISLLRNDTEEVVEYAIGRTPQTAVCWDNEREAFCYANKSGVYQTTADGRLTEKLVDGALTSLVMPTVDIRQLFACSDGSFLVYASDPEYAPMMFRYHYEASVPTSPTTELRIFSLYDIPTIRQAMGSFQRTRPDVTVHYDVGVPEHGDVTEEDALRTLSTQMLAGDGPDLLVLDRLPMDSYLEKGVLADLGVLEGNLLDNVTESFREDGVLYAVPTRFRLPLMISDRETVSQVQTPSALASYLEGRPNPRIGTDPRALLGDWSRFYYPRWITADGWLDAQAYSEDLEALGRIHSLLLEVENPDGGAYSGDYIINALVWKEHAIDLAVCSLFALNNLEGPYTAFLEREGVLTSYPQEGRYFFPTVVLGINAAAKEPALARSFIDCVLSDEQQFFELGDGLPVNLTAYRAILDQKAEHQPAGIWGYDAVNPETGVLEDVVAQLYSPDRAFRKQAVELAQSAETPVMADPGFERVLLEEANRYLAGSCTLDEAVQAAEQKINLRTVE